MSTSPIPPGILCLDDYVGAAEERLPEAIWAYFAGAGADGISQRGNRASFDRFRLAPRVLRDLRGGHTRLRLLGQELAHPLLIAPTAFHRLAHPEGEHATLLGAAATETLAVVSCQASQPMDDMAAAAQGPLWFQLYLQARREDSATLVARAEAAGYRALVVTVDAPVNGIRNHEQRAGFSLPQGIEAVNLRGFASAAPPPEGGSAVFDGLMAAAPTWNDIEWLRGQTRLPILLKGVLSPLDARLAKRIGIDGLILSNHGGRVLDALPAPIEVLPQMRDEVGDLPLLVDGGIRRGTDALIALALGADAVLIGLPILAALAVGGAVGVAHAMTLIRTELEVAMALTGVRTLSELGPEVLFSA